MLFMFGIIALVDDVSALTWARPGGAAFRWAAIGINPFCNKHLCPVCETRGKSAELQQCTNCTEKDENFVTLRRGSGPQADTRAIGAPTLDNSTIVNPTFDPATHDTVDVDMGHDKVSV